MAAAARRGGAAAAVGSTAGSKNRLLTEEERGTLLKPLMDSSWSLGNGDHSISKSFDFDGFPGAMVGGVEFPSC